jgi:hypothetical protein
MGKYLDLARKRFAGTTNTTEHDRSPPEAPLVVFGRIGRTAFDALEAKSSCDKSDKSDKGPPFGRFGRFGRTVSALEARRPDHVPVLRWQQAIKDGRRFLATWGTQAEALGWTNADLFGLHQPPDKRHQSYNRLSRYDATGLCWLLGGREVIAITADTASIKNPETGAITTYRRFNKPALGPLGDSLDDLQ